MASSLVVGVAAGLVPGPRERVISLLHQCRGLSMYEMTPAEVTRRVAIIRNLAAEIGTLKPAIASSSPLQRVVVMIDHIDSFLADDYPLGWQ